MNHTIKSIASQLFKIRHWEMVCDSYENISNEPATWFVDPPYQYGGHCYKHSNKKIDFSQLSTWCKSREGQVIVCENTKATWMKFMPMVTQNVLSGEHHEAIWTNQEINYRKEQMKLFA